MTVDFTRYAESIGRHYFGDPNPKQSKPGVEIRWGENGSMKIDLRNATWFDFEENEGGGLLDLIKLREGFTEDSECFDWMRGMGWDVPEPDGGGKRRRTARRSERRGGGMTIAAVYDYVDEQGATLFQAVRMEPKEFRQRRLMADGGYAWSLAAGRYAKRAGSDAWRKLKDGDRAGPGEDVRDLGEVRAVPYRLPQVLAAVKAGRAIHIVEGEKDVATLEGFGLVATCNAAGVGKWRPEFAEFFQGADVVVFADNDAAGRNHAEDVCAALNGAAARLRRVDLAAVQPALVEKGDVSDWVDDHGGTAALLKEIVAAAPDWTPRPPEPEFPVFRFGDLIDYRPQQEWLVNEWLGAGQLGVLFGRPKSGKSFIALDLGMHIAHGWPWLDAVDVRQGGVFYIAAEGGDGVKKRVAAWAAEYPERRPDAPFFMAPHRFDLFEGEGAVKAIVNYMRAASSALNVEYRLIVVDTLARVFGGGDENFAGDMNRIIESCDRLRAETGCAVLIVHHSAKADGAGMRGSSALYGAVDAVWESKPMEDEDKNEIPNQKELTLRDQKDGEAGASFIVALRRRLLNYDDAGRPVTSCIVENVQDSGSGARRYGESSGGSDGGAASAPPSGAAAPGAASAPGGLSDQMLDDAYAALETAAAKGGEETSHGKAVEAKAWAAAYEGGMAALRAVAKALIEQGRVVRAKVGRRTLYAINDCPF